MTNQREITSNTVTPEQLLHDIITPLLTAKINAELLAEYLPLLTDTLKKLPTPPDEKTLEALARAPEVINNNLAVVQNKYRQLSNVLFEPNNFVEISPTVKNAEISTVSIIQPIRHILLVDDETIHQDIGTRLLSPLYQLDVAKNGLEAISKCKEKSYDLILMDLQMPKMNGVSATEELRKFISKNVIIIGLTSMPLGEKRVDLLALGFNNFLEKPLKLERFQNLLTLLHSSDADLKK